MLKVAKRKKRYYNEKYERYKALRAALIWQFKKAILKKRIGVLPFRFLFLFFFFPLFLREWRLLGKEWGTKGENEKLGIGNEKSEIKNEEFELSHFSVKHQLTPTWSYVSRHSEVKCATHARRRFTMRSIASRTEGALTVPQGTLSWKRPDALHRVFFWPALRDSNPRPTESESGTLFTELRADTLLYYHKAGTKSSIFFAKSKLAWSSVKTFFFWPVFRMLFRALFRAAFDGKRRLPL